MVHVLEGLGHVDWAQYHHAFGSAEDVPRMLRDVMDGGESADRALGELYSTIWHQGTVYSATPLAVPFVAEVAASEVVEIRIRYQLLALLFLIGRGKGYVHVHGDLLGTSPNELNRLLGDEADWVHACRQAIQREADRLLENRSVMPDPLWLAVAVLVIVAGEAGRALAGRIVEEARERVPTFGVLVLETFAELLDGGVIAAERLDKLAALDGDLAWAINDSRETASFGPESDLVDVLAEETWRTEGKGESLQP